MTSVYFVLPIQQKLSTLNIKQMAMQLAPQHYVFMFYTIWHAMSTPRRHTEGVRVQPRNCEVRGQNNAPAALLAGNNPSTY